MEKDPGDAGLDFGVAPVGVPLSQVGGLEPPGGLSQREELGIFLRGGHPAKNPPVNARCLLLVIHPPLARVALMYADVRRSCY